MTNPSDSKVQQGLEKILIEKVQEKLKLPNAPVEKELDYGEAKMKFDGYLEKEDKVLLFEVFTRIEKPKAGQARKVKADILKMIAYKESSSKPCELYLVFPTDQSGESGLKEHFKNEKSWIGAIMKKWDVQLLSFKLEESQLQNLSAAAVLQREGMKGKN